MSHFKGGGMGEKSVSDLTKHYLDVEQELEILKAQKVQLLQEIEHGNKLAKEIKSELLEVVQKDKKTAGVIKSHVGIEGRGTYTISIRRKAPNCIITDQSLVPGFLYKEETIVKREFDKALALKVLRDGEQIPGLELEEGETLQLRRKQ